MAKLTLERFDESVPALKEVCEAALMRYAKGDRLYVTDEEVERTKLPLEMVKKFVGDVFKDMQYRFLMGPSEPKGIL
jgi:hypothetical protein